VILVYTVVHEIQSLRLVLVIGWSEKYLMATTNNHSADASQPSEFELRRAALVSEIGESLEQVLAHVNALNRNLEGIIEIGNEFSSVEALWSQFETVMGRDDQNAQTSADHGGDEESKVEHTQEASR